MDEYEKELAELMRRLMNQTLSAIGYTVLKILEPEWEHTICGTDGNWLDSEGRVIWYGEVNKPDGE